VRYAVVTPAHNEAANLERLHASLGAQSHPAERWVIVENGSTDETLRVASSLASREDWIDVRSIPGSATSDRGAPIVRAIHEGVDVVGDGPDVIAVVDADVTFPVDYFEQLLARFEDDERLGLASGTCYEEDRGEWRERHVTGDHVWGATRAYRREVIPVVMPLEPCMGWDGIDQIKANLAGWRTATFKDLPFFHHRPEGARDGAGFHARVNQGRASYYMGYRPTYLLLRSAFFALKRDRAALGLVWGYALEVASHRPRCEDAGVRRHVRSQQSFGEWRRRLREARGHR
jgi:glycosyltransferase involved in cell wall biosynthesis